MVFSSADGDLIAGANGGSSCVWACPEPELEPELEPEAEVELEAELEVLLPELAGAKAGRLDESLLFLAKSIFSLRSFLPIG